MVRVTTAGEFNLLVGGKVSLRRYLVCLHVRSNAGGGIVAIALVTLVLCSTLGVVSASAALPSESSADRAVGDAPPEAAPPEQRATPQNETNETTRHENPAGADEESNLGAVATHLESTLATRLDNSTLELSQRQYERARSVVGDGYDDQLTKYVDVAGPAGVEESGQSFREAQANQRELVNETRTYWQTYDEYEEAKRSGNERRARRLARQLDETARNVSRTSTDLQGNFRTIQSRTDMDLNASIDRVRDVQRDVEREQDAIRSTEFAATTLAAETDDERISFSDPLSVQGQIRLSNGSTLSNTAVEIRVANRTSTVRTDARGRFSLRYRPTTVPLETRALTVTYVPDDASPYRSANATLSVRIEQVTPSVVLVDSPSVARYGETVVVRGRIDAETVPVRGVPVAVRLGSLSVGTVETNESGTFTVRRTLPADVATGRQNLTASIAFRDRALAATSATETVRIAPTETNLSLSLSGDASDAVRATGRLTTAAGDPAPRQSITLFVAGTPVADVQTDSRGRYDVALPTDAVGGAGNGTVTVVARYDGSGANLASAESRQSFNVGTTAAAGGVAGAADDVVSSWLSILFGDARFGVAPFGADGNQMAVATGVLLIATLVGGTLYTGLRQVGSPETTRSGESRGPDRAGDAVDRSVPVASLEKATTHLSDGDLDAAVIDAYVVARLSLEREHSLASKETHWEFYRTLNDVADADDLSDFRGLTESYEYAAFGPAESSRERAEEAVAAARRITEGSGSESDGDVAE
jgi:hypothetical protein